MSTAILFINEAFMAYTLLVLGILTAIHLLLIIHRRAHDWKLSRVTLRTCKACRLVFAVGRFEGHRTARCPRCGEISHLTDRTQG